jgi:hypothetical protein
MNRKQWGALAVLCTLAVSTVCASAQMAEVKEKPRMYTYVAFWALPRTQWAEEAKQLAGEQKMMEKGISDGQIIAFGNDTTLVHQNDEATHDDWFSAMSMAGLLNLLDVIYKSGSPTSPVDVSATKHSDAIFVSRYYNWHAGSWKGLYSETSMYKLKADAPDNAIETISKNLIVPIMEKMLADGAIHEYEIDTEAVHTGAPGTFWISYIAANSEGIDKVNAAVREAQKTNPMGGTAFGSMVDYSQHRDYLVRTDATYK